MKRTQNHLCVVAPQKPQPKSNHEWASVKSKLKVILQNCWPVIFKHAKVLKDEGSLGPSSRLKETKEMWPNSTGDFNLDPRALQNITRTSGIQPGTLCSAEYHQDQRHSTWTLGLCRISPGPAASNLDPRALENITRTSGIQPGTSCSGEYHQDKQQPLNGVWGSNDSNDIAPAIFLVWARGVVSCLWRSMTLFIGKTLYKVIVGVAFCDSWLPHWPGRKLFCTHNFYHCFKVLQDFILKRLLAQEHREGQRP